VSPNTGWVGHTGTLMTPAEASVDDIWDDLRVTVYECCFCSQSVSDSDSESLFVLVKAGTRHLEDNPPHQEFLCHASCMGTRLAPKVPFDPSMFEG
jgi:hypothetical protein